MERFLWTNGAIRVSWVNWVKRVSEANGVNEVSETNEFCEMSEQESDVVRWGRKKVRWVRWQHFLYYFWKVWKLQDVGVDRKFFQNPKRNRINLDKTALHCESETSRWIHLNASLNAMWNDLWGTRGPETIFDKLTFLLPNSLAKLLSCRSLDVFHKETKCSKWRGPPMRRWISNLDSMCATTSCLHLHLNTLMLLDCFENFAIIKRSVIYVLHQWVPIGNRLFIIQQMGAKRDARGRHATQGGLGREGFSPFPYPLSFLLLPRSGSRASINPGNQAS